MDELECLVRIALKDGSHIAFHRDNDKAVHICHEDHCVILPHATGHLTTELFALLEPLGEAILEEDTNGQ